MSGFGSDILLADIFPLSPEGERENLTQRREGTKNKVRRTSHFATTVTLNLFQGLSTATLKTRTLKQVQGDGAFEASLPILLLPFVSLCLRANQIIPTSQP